MKQKLLNFMSKYWKSALPALSIFIFAVIFRNYYYTTEEYINVNEIVKANLDIFIFLLSVSVAGLSVLYNREKMIVTTLFYLSAVAFAIVWMNNMSGAYAFWGPVITIVLLIPGYIIGFLGVTYVVIPEIKRQGRTQIRWQDLVLILTNLLAVQLIFAVKMSIVNQMAIEISTIMSWSFYGGIALYAITQAVLTRMPVSTGFVGSLGIIYLGLLFGQTYTNITIVTAITVGVFLITLTVSYLLKAKIKPYQRSVQEQETVIQNTVGGITLEKIIRFFKLGKTDVKIIVIPLVPMGIIGIMTLFFNGDYGKMSPLVFVLSYGSFMVAMVVAILSAIKGERKWWIFGYFWLSLLIFSFVQSNREFIFIPLMTITPSIIYGVTFVVAQTLKTLSKKRK